MYGLRLFFNVKVKVKGYKPFSMMLHILPPESMTVQNFSSDLVWLSYATSINEGDENYIV